MSRASQLLSTKPQTPSALRRPLLSAVLIGVLVLAVLPIRQAAAGPKGRILRELATAAAVALGAHYGAKALAERNTEREQENEADPFKQCFIDLFSQQAGEDSKDSAVTQVLDGLQHDFRMDKPTAEDIVYAVVVDLCLRHSTQPYDNLGAAFYRASANRAIKYYRRYQLRYRTCENIEDLAASCPIRFGNRFPRPDANVRLNSEVDVARRAWCSLTLQDQQILANRAIGAQTFAQIATEIGLTSGQAKDRYHNTLRRVQAQVARTCPNY